MLSKADKLFKLLDSTSETAPLPHSSDGFVRDPLKTRRATENYDNLVSEAASDRSYERRLTKEQGRKGVQFQLRAGGDAGSGA